MENQSYTMPFFRCADIYLGLVMIIRLSEERVHCELVWSPDMVSWERISSGTPFISNSPNKGDYDWGCIYAADAPIVTKKEIRIYYAGSNGMHRYWRDGFLCLATLRPDGWAGYEPVDVDQTAMVVTKPLVWRGKLRLTADSAGGSVLVKVVDSRGKVLAVGQPVKASVTDAKVSFSNPAQLEHASGQYVCLKFVLQRAKLYSFVLKD